MELLSLMVVMVATAAVSFTADFGLSEELKKER